jgi:hypothetical protein
MITECDVCLEPIDGGVFDPPVTLCLDCLAFSVAAGVTYAAAADFLELRRMRLTAEDLGSIVDGDELSADRCGIMDQVEEPELAAELVRPALPPDPGDPDPAANMIRVWQWPSRCGQWYALLGSPGHRRSIQYGPMSDPGQLLEMLGRYLSARRHSFDGGYQPPAAG